MDAGRRALSKSSLWRSGLLCAYANERTFSLCDPSALCEKSF
jgi:hypothetical protein